MGIVYIISVILLIRFFSYVAEKLKDKKVSVRKEYDGPHEEFINEYPTEETTTIMQTPKENQTEGTVINIKALLIETVRQLGCEPEEVDENSVITTFQGEKFYINVGGMFINIWDLGWSSINVNDLNLPKLRRAINRANIEFGPTIVLGEPAADGTMDISSRYGIVLHPSLPDLHYYLKYALELFFQTKNNLHKSYNMLLIEEEKQNSAQNPQDINPCNN